MNNGSQYPSYYRWVVLGILCVCFFLYSANWFVIVPAIPLFISDLGLTNAQALSLISIFLLTYGLFQIPSGLLAAKIGTKRTLVSALIIESLFSMLLGLSQNYSTLLVLRFIVGIGAGLFFAAAVGALTPWFLGTNRLGFAVSLTTGAFYNLGVAVPILFGSSLISLLGWRFLFIILGFSGFAIAVTSYFLIKSPVKIDPTKNAQIFRDVKDTLKNKNIWFLGFAIAGLFGSTNAFTGFLPEFMTTFRGWDQNTAGLFTGIGSLAGLFIIPIIGWLSDMINSRKIQIIIGGLVSTLLVWLYGELMFPLIWVVPFLVVISTNFIFINSFALPAEYLGSKVGSIGLGLMMEIGLVGSFWIPYYMGLLVDQGILIYGFIPHATSIAWLFVALTNLTAVIFGILLQSPKKQVNN